MFGLALTIALTIALTNPTSGDGGPARGVAVGGCPHGDVEIVASKAKANFTVRFVNSRAAADCVVRWVTVAPGPGHWRQTSSFPDFRIYVTDGIADLTVLAE